MRWRQAPATIRIAVLALVAKVVTTGVGEIVLSGPFGGLLPPSSGRWASTILDPSLLIMFGFLLDFFEYQDRYYVAKLLVAFVVFAGVFLALARLILTRRWAALVVAVAVNAVLTLFATLFAVWVTVAAAYPAWWYVPVLSPITVVVLLSPSALGYLRRTRPRRPFVREP